MGGYTNALLGSAVLIAGVIGLAAITSTPTAGPAPAETRQPAVAGASEQTPDQELDYAIGRLLSESSSSSVGPADELPAEVLRVLVAHGVAVESNMSGTGR